ncbi:PilW family protein [Ottowia thiooxydans]|uniref:PilW family protein n=1 Tax=Ottowia thiooxydans TaxID=219182 RepID=UPI0003FD7873|nr:PilW family protein [Ottowia thiooxydans]
MSAAVPLFSAKAYPTQMQKSNAGFTLLELLIALTIGLVILTAGLALYSSTSRGSQVSQYEAQLNEDGLVSLNLIQNQIKQAGYSQQIIPTNGATISGNFFGIAVRGCDGGFSSETVAFGSLACTTGSGSDAIAIRYQATPLNTYRTAGGAATNCIGNGITANAASQAAPAPSPAPGTYALADNRYFVRTSSGLPNLMCRGITNSIPATPTGDTQPLMPNVEEMQLLYGVASHPSAELATSYDPMRHQIIAYLTATQIDALPSSSKLPNITDDRWGRVLSVRICLLIRSEQPMRDVPTGGHAYKTCDNSDAAGTDGYLRRTFTTTVLLRNRLIIP